MGRSECTRCRCSTCQGHWTSGNCRGLYEHSIQQIRRQEKSKMNKIRVTFVCRTCKLKKTSVNVNPQRPTQNFQHWVEYVRAMMALKHKALSPTCPCQRFDVL